MTTTTKATADLRYIASHIEYLLDSILSEQDLDRKVGAYRFVHALQKSIVDVEDGYVELRAAIKIADIDARCGFNNSDANLEGIEAGRQLAVAAALLLGWDAR